jgi:hypothetical protein
LQDALKKHQEQESDEDEDAKSVSSASVAEQDSEEEEEGIQSEIAAMRQRRSREKKKVKKKERALAAKRRRRAALGMDLNAVEVPEHDQIFSLATISSKGDLEAAREVDLDKVTDEQLFGGSSDEEDNADQDEVESQGEPDDLDEETGYSYRLDRELDDAYETYLHKTKDGIAKRFYQKWPNYPRNFCVSQGRRGGERSPGTNNGRTRRHAPRSVRVQRTVTTRKREMKRTMGLTRNLSL